MSKIQILNETQVNHYVEVLLPILEVDFNKKADELEKKAKAEQDNFVEDPEVIKLKNEQKEKLDKINKLYELTKQLRVIGKDYRISNSNYYKSSEIVTTDEELAEVITDMEEEVKKLTLKLSEKNFKVDLRHFREHTMKDELRARLSMTSVMGFDEIKKLILGSIDVNSYFTNIIN